MTGYPALSESMEDYLEIVYHLHKTKGGVKVRDIARRMNVSSPSVSGALHNLAKKGLVNYTPHDVITLTPEGEIIALDVIKRHVSLKNFLENVLSMDSGRADEVACKMEHSIPPDVLERLISFIHYVKTCPASGAKWIDGRGFICEEKSKNDLCDACDNIGKSEI